MILFPGLFFIFSKVWFSQFSGGWKDKKCPKMTKKSVWHALKFQETCIYFMWSSFMVHMCKRIISPGIFFNFWKFSFSGSLGGEGVKGKKWPKMTKELCLPHTISQELYIISLWFLVHMFKMMISPAIFFFFKKYFSFFGFQVNKRVKSDLKLLISVCLALNFRNCRSYWDFWYTGVKIFFF